MERQEHDNELQELVGGEVAALEALSMHVTQDQADMLAERIVEAEVVYLFGQGNASVLVELLLRRLNRFGIRSTQLVGSQGYRRAYRA